VLEDGAARLVEYDMRSPDDVLLGIGVGSEGAMLVLSLRLLRPRPWGGQHCLLRFMSPAIFRWRQRSDRGFAARSVLTSAQSRQN
jgi:hypothetical protein